MRLAIWGIPMFLVVFMVTTSLHVGPVAAENKALQLRVQAMLNGASEPRPNLLVRFGYADTLPRSLRRPVSVVMLPS